MKSSKKDRIKLITKSICIVIIIILFIIQSYKISELNNKISILGKRIYYLEQTQEKEKYAHLSIDDTIEIFEDLYKNERKYKSIFDNSLLKYLKELHDTYGVVVSCYCWYENDGFDLSMLSNKYAEEFKKNSDWLRFGFHAYDRYSQYNSDEQSETILNDYVKVTNELIRITGGTESIDNIIRLHYYAGSKKCVDAIKNTENGIKGLLTADIQEDISYYFSQKDSYYLYTHDQYVVDDLYFINTDFRMENYKDIQIELDSYAKTHSDKINTLEFFTHEWNLNNFRVRENIEKTCYYAVINKYNWQFPEEQIERESIR